MKAIVLILHICGGFRLYSAAAATFSLSPSLSLRATVCLQQLSELRLVFSFFRERKRTKKAFRGGVPPPQKLLLPRLGQATSRHRSSDASVWHLKCGVRYSLQCSTQIMPEPLGGADLLLQRTRMGTACTARAAARSESSDGKVVLQLF